MSQKDVEAIFKKVSAELMLLSGLNLRELAQPKILRVFKVLEEP